MKFSKDELQVFKNFVFLAVLQATNYLAPLITLPYLSRVIGVENVGSINIAVSITLCLMVITNYGFNLTGTKYISKNSGNLKKIARYYSAAMAVRLILLVISGILLLMSVYFIEKLNDIWLVCLLSFGLVISQYLFPYWVFHGFQKMRYITILNGISKLIFISLIFLLVKDKNDYYLVPLITSLGGIITGGASLWIVSEKFHLTIKWLSRHNLRLVKIIFKRDIHVFLQQLYMTIQSPINIIILGLISSSLTVGYYAIAEKIVSIPVMFAGIAVQAYYPHAVKLYSQSQSQYYSQFRVLIYFILACTSLLMVIAFTFDDLIFSLFTGHTDSHAITVFNILLLSVIFGCFAQLVMQTFVIINKSAALNKIYLTTFIISIVLAPLFIYWLDAVGLAIVTTLRQIVLISICFIYLRLYGNFRSYKALT